uniref:WD_REPEATS_REGION domain-containing protein n=1 Tax=Panagrellus redivivus TaxID=6233 RepID=A0A7E4UL43_PANRE
MPLAKPQLPRPTSHSSKPPSCLLANNTSQNWHCPCRKYVFMLFNKFPVRFIMLVINPIMASINDILGIQSCEVKAELIDASYDSEKPPVLVASATTSEAPEEPVVEASNTVEVVTGETKPEVLEPMQQEIDSVNPEASDDSDDESPTTPPKIEEAKIDQDAQIEPSESLLDDDFDQTTDQNFQMPGLMSDMTSISQEFNFDELFTPEMMTNMQEYGEQMPETSQESFGLFQNTNYDQLPVAVPSVKTPQHYHQPDIDVEVHYTSEEPESDDSDQNDSENNDNSDSTHESLSSEQQTASDNASQSETSSLSSEYEAIKPYRRFRKPGFQRKYPYFFKPLPADEYEEPTIEAIGYPLNNNHLESDCQPSSIPQYSNYNVEPTGSPEFRPENETKFEESRQNTPSLFFIKNALKKFNIAACGNDFSNYNYTSCDESHAFPEEVIRVARGEFSGFAAISYLLTGEQRHWSKIKNVLTMTVLKLRKMRRGGIRSALKRSPDSSLFGPLNQAHLEAFAYLTEARVFVYGGKVWRDMFGTPHQNCVSLHGNNEGFESIDMPTFCLSIDEKGDYNVVKSVK